MKIKEFIEMILLFEPFGIVVFITMILGLIFSEKYKIYFLIIGITTLIIIDEVNYHLFHNLLSLKNS